MGDNTRRDPRAKVLSMTVRYRSATLGEFIEHHSYDVSRGGLFIKTPSPFPAGTLLKFEVKIADEQRVMQGVGRVVWKRENNGATDDEPAGMGIKFIKIDDASKAVIERLMHIDTDFIIKQKEAMERARQIQEMQKQQMAMRQVSSLSNQDVAPGLISGNSSGTPAGLRSQPASGVAAKGSLVVNSDEAKKVGRNDPCPCGSGKKYKKCHGKAN